MSFYNKYRPVDFDDLIGQQVVKDILINQLTKQQTSHNYLFHGPRGTWKTSMARLLAKSINILAAWWSLDDLKTHEISELINKGKTIDYVEIDAASHTSVSNIREEILDKAVYQPVQLHKKVYVIDEVHMLSKSAFNALLKIMEEPPEYLTFILATTEIHKIPDTIISRCQVFNFTHHTIDDLSARLQHIAELEKITTEPEALRMIAKLAQWAVRDAVKYLEQVSILGDVTVTNVQTFLWVVSETVITDMIDAVKSNDFTRVSTQLDELYAWGTDVTALVKDILLYMDQHFIQDPAVYSTLARVWMGIYTKLRGAVSPILLCKAELWSYMHPDPNIAISTHEVNKKSTTPIPQSAPVVETPSIPDIPTNTVTQKEVSSVPKASAPIDTSDLTALKQTLITYIDKMMVKSSLTNYTTIVNISDDAVIHMVCVQEQFAKTLQKSENLSYLALKCTEMLWSEHTVSVSYMSKEELLMKQMAG